ncbi:MAG: 16S rRNA (guanine(527)-N(7))-methyltransferase RsmG [Pseudanabaenaceae cyanobacterium bins.39]|nr:16S rRNA (guanine(527)-N(7))-methyltransferase RsmG [Pseudanabaenaceae cyanobacterium bins.39]
MAELRNYQKGDILQTSPIYQLFSQLFQKWQGTLSWLPSDDQIAQFAQLYDLVLEGNSQQNLTRITIPEDFWEKHLWDSLRGIGAMVEPENIRMVDIGTGAGFPGLAIAIAKPSWQVTLIDSTQKKIAFVEQAIQKLQLANANTVVGRAEMLNQQRHHRSKYDLAVIRAVGKPDLCAKYCLPFLNKNGTAILYRGQWLPEESEQLDAFCEHESWHIIKEDKFQTPITHGIRHSIYLSLQSTSISGS